MKAALAHNDLVTAVGKAYEDTSESMASLYPASSHPASTRPAGSAPVPPSPSKEQNSTYLPLRCDVRVRSTVQAVFTRSLEHWGRMDIIANCSGYGVIGACEDQDEYEIRNQFETNFWGALNILQLSLPYFRERGVDHEGERLGGRYLIFSSTSGALGVPGLGPFCATKYAVEGLIESMLYETDAFNIRATLVEPGHVRRDDPPSIGSAASPLPTFGHFLIKPASVPYAGSTAPAGHAKRMVQWLGDRQPTSAVKAAELVWQLGHCSYPPLRLLLGSFAVESVRDRLRCVTEEIEDWKWLAFKGENGEDGQESQRGSQRDGDDEGDEDGEEHDVKMEDGNGEKDGEEHE